MLQGTALLLFLVVAVGAMAVVSVIISALAPFLASAFVLWIVILVFNAKQEQDKDMKQTKQEPSKQEFAERPDEPFTPRWSSLAPPRRNGSDVD